MMYFNIRDKTANSLINYLRFYLFAREERLELPTPAFCGRGSTQPATPVFAAAKVVETSESASVRVNKF